METKSIFSKAVKYVVVVAVIVAIVITVRFFASKKQVEYEPPAAVVSVMYPVMGNIEENIVLSAHIEARAMVPVIPMVSGTVLEYPISAGDMVNKGDIIAKIDDAPFEQQMLQAQAAYQGYNSSFTRVEALYRAGAATRQDYDSLKAQRDAAKAQYDLAELQMGYANVTAPVGGTVIAAPLAVGGVAGAPNPIAVIANLDDLVVKLNVPEKYYSVFVKNRNNLKAVVKRPDYEGSGEQNTCEAVVDTIAPYIDGMSKTFETVFKLRNVPIDFKPGMFVQIDVVFNEYKNVPLIPVTSRLSDGTVYFLRNGAGDGQNIVGGTVECITLNKAVSDSQWLMVPPEYTDRVFIVKGQNNVLSGQSVNASYESTVWSNKKEAR